MGLETSTYLDGLQAVNPLAGDDINKGDDHIRLIKSVIKATFPGAGGNGFASPITASEAELNFVDGVTSPIQTQLNTLIANSIPAGTRMLFAQGAAPSGWTQVNADESNNRGMRIVNGGGGGTFGSHDPSVMNVVPYHTHGIGIGATDVNHTHHFDTSYSGNHTHGYAAPAGSGNYAGGPYSVVNGSTGASTDPGGNHNHYGDTGWSNEGSVNHAHSAWSDGGSSQTNWSPRMINLIMCSKN